MPQTFRQTPARHPGSPPRIPVIASEPAFSISGTRCSFMATALYTRKGCRQIQEFTVEVFEISHHSLRIRSPLAAFLPDNFTLILGARQHGIGCSVVDRVKDTVRCNLIRRETEGMVSYLASLKDPKQTLEEIRDPLFPRGMITLRR